MEMWLVIGLIVAAVGLGLYLYYRVRRANERLKGS
jgi:hypothetical protein